MPVLEAPAQRFTPLPGAQTEFMSDMHHRYPGLIGGKGCITGDALIYDPMRNEHRRVDELSAAGKQICVLALYDDGAKPARATAPFIKGIADTYEFTLADGSSATVTKAHRFLTEQGWRSAGGLKVGHAIAVGKKPKLMPIVSIDPRARQQYFDLTVPGPGNYLANGIWHHNSGKSFVGAQKLAETHVINCGLIPNEPFIPIFMRSLVIAQSYQMLQTVNVPQIVRAFENIGLEVIPILDPKKLMIVVPDLAKSEILLRSADSPEKINGFEAGCVWCDESSLYPWSETEPLKDAVIMADGRLRDLRAKVRQMFFTFTPEGTSTRMFRDFETGFWMDGNVRRPGKKGHVLYRAKTADNPHIDPEYVAQIKSQYSAEIVKQYLDGITAESNAGRVFSSFDEDRNTDDTLKLDPYVPLQLSVDFNVSMHGVVGQHFPTAGTPLTTSLYELYDRNMTIPQMITALVRLCESVGWKWDRPLEVYGDPAGHQRQGGRGESQWEVLTSHLKVQGIPYRLIVGRSHASVADRVSHANAALFNAEGKVRWKIHPTRCIELVKDLKFLTWKPDGTIDKRDVERSHMAEADTNRIYQLVPITKFSLGNQDTARVMAY